MHISWSRQALVVLALSTTCSASIAASTDSNSSDAPALDRLDPLLRYELERTHTGENGASVGETRREPLLAPPLSATPYVPAPQHAASQGPASRGPASLDPSLYDPSLYDPMYLDAVPDVPASEDRYLACWVRIEPGTVLPSELSLELHGDRIASARLRISEIEQLVRLDGVVAIEAARQARPSLDLSVPEIGATAVHAGTGLPPLSTGKTGTDAVVGIVDTGIDVTHADFLSDYGTRIVGLWDQTAASVHPPDAFGYGREWTPTEIDAGSATETDSDGHGTHVAGTAAGSGSATGNGEPAGTFVGVAPDAKLVVVKTDFYTSSIVDAIDYVFTKAAELNLPAVVNLSLGHHYGPHDGTEATDLAIDALVGPGRIVVAAAGNEQEDGIHAERSIARGATEEIRLEVPSYDPHLGLGNDLVLIDGYYDAESSLQLTVITPSGYAVGPVVPGQTVETATGDGAVRVENDVYDATTSDRNLHVQIWDDRTGEWPKAGTWSFLLENTSPVSAGEGAQADFWIYYQSLSSIAPPQFDASWGMTAQKLVASPASADSVIAVAAYVTRTSWQSIDGSTYSYNPTPQLGDIAPFSSRGPRRDGVIKPDIAAPGMGIAAALSADHRTSGAWILPDGVHFITQGTSMASPHVAGVVALLLDTKGFLSRNEVVSTLSSSARRDPFTGSLPNAAFGAGKVDALAALVGPTPVLLVGFDSSREDDGVHLRWSTSESMSDLRFQVERANAAESAEGDAERELVGTTGRGPDYEIIDTEAPVAVDLTYWLTAVQYDRVVLGPFTVPQSPLPRDLAVSPPWPSPFSSEVQWTVTLPTASELMLDVVDVTGRRVATLENRTLPAGASAFTWDGRTDAGDRLGSGVYWLRALSNGKSTTTRLVLVR